MTLNKQEIPGFLGGRDRCEIMLRNRSTPVQKDHSKGLGMPDSDSCFSSDAVVQKTRSTTFFSVPGLFVGFSTKGLSDSDSARSPTSPLDYKAFSNLCNSFVRSPSSPGFDGSHKSWDCNRVGLGIVDSLNDETKPCGKVIGFSESRNILFGSRMRINTPSPKTCLDHLLDDPAVTAPKSLPKNYGVSSQTHIGSTHLELDYSKVVLGSGESEFEPGEFGKMRSCSADIFRSSSSLTQLTHCNPKSNSEIFSSDSKKPKLSSPLARGSVNFDSFTGSLPISSGSSHGLMGSLSASGIELSEDYTCIISHGPNPKTTHIFGDCILESHTNHSPCSMNKHMEEGGGSPWLVKCSEDLLPYPSDDFLSFCFTCKKKLEEGKDIYMYRGEKAFCSCDCRDQEILIEEEMEIPTIDSSDSPASSFHEEIFLAGIV